jgi:hypothetical protein
MPTDQRHLKVFLCHASTDKPKVRELYRFLRRRRIRPWFDEIDLVAGQDWQVEIPKALVTSDAIIICLTKNSVDKEGYVQKEIKFALDKALEMPEGRIFLIPVRFEDCEVPSALMRYQWVDLFDETGYSKMMMALKLRAKQLDRPVVEIIKKSIETKKPIPVPDEHWQAIEKVPRNETERDTTGKPAEYPWARIRGMQQFMEFTRDPDWKPLLIDVSLLKKLGLAISKEREVIHALRFLGVIDKAGIPTKDFDHLQRDYQGMMRKLVLEKYKELFNLLPRDLINQMRLVQFFGSSADTSEYQAKLFSWFCDQAGIDLPNLEKRFMR